MEKDKYTKPKFRNKKSNSHKFVSDIADSNFTMTLHLSRIYTGDFFACDFLIKMDVAKLHLFNNGSHCDESYLTAENDCLKLFPFR